MKRIKTEHGIFTSNEITGKSAEEVYKEWLTNKDKQIDILSVKQKKEKTLKELTEENEQLW